MSMARYGINAEAEIPDTDRAESEANQSFLLAACFDMPREVKLSM